MIQIFFNKITRNSLKIKKLKIKIKLQFKLSTSEKVFLDFGTYKK